MQRAGLAIAQLAVVVGPHPPKRAIVLYKKIVPVPRRDERDCEGR